MSKSWMLFATVGAIMLIGIVVASIRVARRRLRYESWHLLHLYAYLGMAFVFPHQLANGADFHDPCVADFGQPAGSCGPGGYPQARVVALVECRTHAVIDAAIGGRGQGETTVAVDLAAAAGPGTLVLADRNMLGVELWNAFLASGAQLLWRLKRPSRPGRHRLGRR